MKVGAYLTQEMGFTNVSRLAGGIIAYDRTLNTEAPEEEPMFKGTNYVFDGRLGRQITDDALGDCITCGAKTNLVTNCKNSNCHKRMVQCEKCQPTYLGTCSHACKNRVMNEKMMSEKKAPLKKNDVKYDTIDDYSMGHSTPPGDLYEEMKSNTAEFLGSGLHMISDTMQGRMLYSLASMTREGRILEIGGFTGYATCCFLEGAAAVADSIGHDSVGCREGGPFVMSLERDNRAIDIAASHVGIMAKYGIGPEAASEVSKLREKGIRKFAFLSHNISFFCNIHASF